MTNAKAQITRHNGKKATRLRAGYGGASRHKENSLRAQPFGPEPFGSELKAELLMAEGRALR